MKTNSHARALSAEIMQALSDLLDESARADKNMPTYDMQENLYKALDRVKDDIIAKLSATDVAKDMLGEILKRKLVDKIIIELINDYVDAEAAEEAYQEYLASGRKTITHEELIKKYVSAN